MPQEIRVVQCYICQMHQVDIVKKVNKWTCKLCGEKQSLKTVIFQGSGKECRLQVQKLNGSKASTERSHFNELVSNCAGQSSDLPEEVRSATQTNWSDFVDEDEEDALYDAAVLNMSSSEYIPTQESNQENEPDNHRTEQDNDSATTKECVDQAKRNHENVTHCSTDGPVAKVRKIDSNIAPLSEWEQFLPDELSD